MIINHKWRRIVSSALLYYWSHARTELGYENEDFLDDLLIDLYNTESLVNRKFTSGNIDLVSNKTTSSLTGVAIAGTNVVWTPTYPNWKITFSNMDVVNSAAGEEVNIYVEVIGHAPSGIALSHTQGTTRRQMMAQARYTGMPVGVSKTARLMWNVTGGTATMNLGSWLSYEIEEWSD